MHNFKVLDKVSASKLLILVHMRGCPIENINDEKVQSPTSLHPLLPFYLLACCTPQKKKLRLKRFPLMLNPLKIFLEDINVLKEKKTIRRKYIECY